MNSKPESDYNLSNDDLLKAFVRAVRKAAATHSGLLAKLNAGDEESYFCGILLARLEGANPPMNAGDVVQNKRAYPAGKPFNQKTVKRVYYVGDGDWHVIFIRNDRPFSSCSPRSPAGDFELVPTAESCSPA